MKALAPGMMVMGVIFFMGTISGAHLNPAVTLAFAVRGNFPWRRVPGYIVAEVLRGDARGAVPECDVRRDPERRHRADFVDQPRGGDPDGGRPDAWAGER